MTKVIKCIKDVPCGDSLVTRYFYKDKTYPAFEINGELYAWDELGLSHGVKDGKDDIWFNRHFIFVESVNQLSEGEINQFQISYTEARIEEVKNEIVILKSDLENVCHEKVVEHVEKIMKEYDEALAKLLSNLLELKGVV
ncbi:hypothetical protein PQE70_gp033 [Bacillus phage vB_BanS_Nate]|uniref:Uncharacterized protein n=1 Tax=Bacillus phage vB_BanS_Nate TaxID=2894788 RepID=A0AAE8YUP7_9CAUD|nr:hypothetical protein PQE70_gp033 [Bacillus phage vB_BanS_Nate]UGO50886.1 hypothetical protein NATE_33 [Bacillus phage vB_BanS_Nate]